MKTAETGELTVLLTMAVGQYQIHSHAQAHVQYIHTHAHTHARTHTHTHTLRRVWSENTLTHSELKENTVELRQTDSRHSGRE